MRKIIPALLLVLAGTALPSIPEAARAQTMSCYKKVCLEYPDGLKVCQLTPVDCSAIQIQ